VIGNTTYFVNKMAPYASSATAPSIHMSHGDSHYIFDIGVAYKKDTDPIIEIADTASRPWRIETSE
jgi:hypothetical protein